MAGMERPPPRPPDREDRHDGLAYALWLPDRMGAAGEAERGARSRRLPPPPWPGIVICHGAGSRKENHADFARLAAASGWAALGFDARGHGASEGEISSGAIDDVIRMVRLLAAHDGIDPRRVAVRGSSMGGFLAIHAAAVAGGVAGVIAICPAGEDHLSRGVRRGELEMRVGDPLAMEAWLAGHDLRKAVERLGRRPLILLHAEGDDQIPSDWSEELYEHAVEPRKLVVVPGGDHRSLQHDPELQAVALRWLERELAAPRAARPGSG
jgi:alpha-beta hydrolase superfamily lysophospholipase